MDFPNCFIESNLLETWFYKLMLLRAHGPKWMAQLLQVVFLSRWYPIKSRFYVVYLIHSSLMIKWRGWSTSGVFVVIGLPPWSTSDVMSMFSIRHFCSKAEALLGYATLALFPRNIPVLGYTYLVGCWWALVGYFEIPVASMSVLYFQSITPCIAYQYCCWHTHMCLLWSKIDNSQGGSLIICESQENSLIVVLDLLSVTFDYYS